jgi:glycosyltransferase involved in cell wall biosynthesis
VYNGARFLQEAIDSMAHQTFEDWELIVVDDCSTDDTAAILAQAQERDNRIRVHRLPENLGATRALNQGARIARGTLIARMDADDVSLPTRLEKQVRYLETHPEIAVVGSWVRRLDENGLVGALHRYPTSPALVAWSFFFFNALAHPTVLMRRSALDMESVYDPQYRLAQDYELFTRLSRRTLLANIPEVLLHYRFWSGNSSRKPAQELAATQIVKRHAETMGVNVTDAQIRALQGLARDRYLDTPKELVELAQLIDDLRLAAHRSLPPMAHKSAIDVEAALRIWQLSLSAATRAPRQSLTLAVKALVLSPRSVFAICGKAASRLRSKRQRDTTPL